MKTPLILLVDDNPHNLQVLGTLLEERYHTAVAESGALALEFVRKKRPDLILLDIIMPEMDGLEVCRQLQQEPTTREIPIIFLTARTDIDDVLKGFEAGAVDYITKPFNGTELLARVNTHLELKQSKEQYKLLSEELELSHAKLDVVFQNVPEGIITVDTQERVLQKNAPLAEICPPAWNAAPETPLESALGECQGECLKILRYTLETGQPVKEYHGKCTFQGGADKSLILNSAPLLDSRQRLEGVLLVIRDITHLEELENQLRAQSSFMGIIGHCPKMQHVYTLIRQLADVDTTVLITGESGTGKEVVMEAIHHSGARSSGPLVRLNCSVLPENILESELFGHVRGAFTGATKDRVGRIQAANGGTLFLDEIGDLSPYIQLKLLRFLERKEYERVGDNRTFQADVRILAATHVDLAAQVRQGLFREDFYYRLRIVNIQLPPLRERREDISLLVEHFCQVFRERFHKHIHGVSPEAFDLFMHYTWPGNVRELQHALEHAFVLCPNGIITLPYLPPEIQYQPDPNQPPPTGAVAPKAELGADDILTALQQAHWKKGKAAQLLGIHRTTLYRKMLEFGIDR